MYDEYISSSSSSYDQRKKANYKMTYMIVSSTFGFSTISELAVMYFLKDNLKIEPATLSFLFSIIMIPWSIKPIFGILSDIYPLFGYRRKSYLIISGLFGSSSWFCMFFLYETLTVMQTFTFLLIISCSLAFCSVLGEALVVELSLMEDQNSKDQSSKNYVSYFFLLKYAGGFVAALMKGVLIDLIGIRNVFLIGSVIPLLMMISGLILDESEHNLHIAKVNHENVTEEEMIFASDENFFKKFYKFITQKYVLLPTAFMLVLLSMPSYSDPMFYFSTNVLNFTPTDMGYISVFSYLGVIIALILYRLYFKNYSFKSLMIGSTTMYFVFASLTYVLAKRYNIALGIPDFLLVCIAFSMQSLCGEITVIPMLTLACVFCPKNLEATIYAYFISIVNLGFLIGIAFGATLTSLLGIKADNFTNLPYLILVANFFSLIPLLWLLWIDESYFNPTTNSDSEKDTSEDKQEKIN